MKSSEFGASVGVNFAHGNHYDVIRADSLIADFLLPSGRVDTLGLARNICCLAQADISTARYLCAKVEKSLELHWAPMDCMHFCRDMGEQFEIRFGVSGASSDARDETVSSEQKTDKPGNAFGADDALSLTLDMLPLVGTAKGVVELAIGRDPITGEEIPRWQSAVGLLASMIPGGKVGVRGGLEVAEQIGKHGGEVVNIGTQISTKITGQLSKRADDGIKVAGKEAEKAANLSREIPASVRDEGELLLTGKEHELNLKAAQEADKISAPIDFDGHILSGEVKPNGSVVGGHSTSVGNVRVIPGTRSQPNAHGVYMAKIEVADPANPGRFLAKTNNGGISTMFPDSWTADRIKVEVDAAFKNRVVSGNKWTGVTPSGVTVEGWLVPKTTAYPKF